MHLQGLMTESSNVEENECITDLIKELNTERPVQSVPQCQVARPFSRPVPQVPPIVPPFPVPQVTVTVAPQQHQAVVRPFSRPASRPTSHRHSCTSAV